MSFVPRSKFIAGFLCLVALSVAVPVSLSGRPSQLAPPDQARAESDRIQRLNDIAKFCAGLPPSDTSTLSALAHSKAWIAYAAKEDKRWLTFRSLEAKMRAWADANISPRAPANHVIFYPFGGPDILYADIFFPSASLYVSIGLESVGAAPDEEMIWQSRLKSFLGEYSQAFDDIFIYSFFARFDMSTELSGHTVNGLTPVFMVLLARMGKEIVALEPGDFSEAGEFVPASAGTTARSRALRIRYRNPSDSSVSTIIYLSQDLTNSPFEKNKAFFAFMDKNLPGCFTFIKAASYLMHNIGFSTIRNRILQYSTAVLQDDSGLMYKSFDPEVWDLNLFGAYTGPHPAVFKGYYETALANAFKGKEKPLDFRFGYSHSSDLLWAVKKAK